MRLRKMFYVLQRTECFQREKTQITRTHCWLCFSIRNSHGGGQKILVSEGEGRSPLLESVFAWMQGTCCSGSSEIPTAQKVEAAPGMVPTCDWCQMLSIVGLLDLLLQCKVKLPKTTYPRSSDTQHFAGNTSVYMSKNKKRFCWVPVPLLALRYCVHCLGHGPALGVTSLPTPHAAPCAFERQLSVAEMHWSQQHLVSIWAEDFTKIFQRECGWDPLGSGVVWDKGRGSSCLGLSPDGRDWDNWLFPHNHQRWARGRLFLSVLCEQTPNLKATRLWLNSDPLKRNLDFPWREAQRSQAPNGLQGSAIPTATAARGGFGLDAVVSEQEDALPCENSWEGGPAKMLLWKSIYQTHSVLFPRPLLMQQGSG